VKTQTLILISITASLVLSIVITLATYNVISYPTDIILDAAWNHRGWPLYWMIESWSFWSPPPYPHHFTFQPMNFLVDIIFYTIISQIPIQIYMHSRRRQKTEASTPTRPCSPSTWKCALWRLYIAPLGFRNTSRHTPYRFVQNKKHAGSRVDANWLKFLNKNVGGRGLHRLGSNNTLQFNQQSSVTPQLSSEQNLERRRHLSRFQAVQMLLYQDLGFLQHLSCCIHESVGLEHS
jgi:hypothetical protein